VTNFVKSQITNSTTGGVQQALLLSVPPPANTASFARAVLADPTYPISQRVTLSVYYISLYPILINYYNPDENIDHHIAAFGHILQGYGAGNFPYSQMGIGDLEDEFYNRTSGLANTGIAYRSNRFLITNNPASLSGLTDQYFTMETGIRGSFINYSGKPVDLASTQSGDITFRRLVMGIKASKHWGTSIGLVPFSTQNYEFNVPYFLLGSATEIANHYYQGHGSVNKLTGPTPTSSFITCPSGWTQATCSAS